MAFIGSVNMDYRSFQLHFECGTLLYGTAASQPLAEDMARIAASGERMTMKRWKSRPWYHKALARCCGCSPCGCNSPEHEVDL